MSSLPGPALPPTDDLAEIERRLAAMPLLTAMDTQRAVRRVLPDPVSDAVVLRLLRVALEAPTGSNGQNWEFVVVRDRAIKQALQRQYRGVWRLYGGLGRLLRKDEQTRKILKSVDWQVKNFDQIPVLVIACLRGGSSLPGPVAVPVLDSSHYGSIYPAVQNLLLAARAVGLGGSLVTLPLWSTRTARRLLGLPRSVEPCCVVPLGWAKGKYGPKPRRAVGDVVHLDRYGVRPWRRPAVRSQPTA